MTNIRRLPLEVLPPFGSGAPELLDEADAAMEIYKDQLLGLQWQPMHTHSATLAGLADKVLRDIQSRSDLEDRWAIYLGERDSNARKAFAGINDNPGSPEAIRKKPPC